MPEDPNAAENLLLEYLTLLPPQRRQFADLNSRAAFKARSNSRQRSYLAQVDLTNSKPVEEQVAQLLNRKPSRFSAAQVPVRSLAGLGRFDTEPAVRGIRSQRKDCLGQSAPAPPTNTLELRVQVVRCVDETNGFFGREDGDDEIYLGATTVNESGEAAKVAQYKVGDFNDGTIVNYSPARSLAVFNLPETAVATHLHCHADLSGGRYGWPYPRPGSPRTKFVRPLRRS